MARRSGASLSRHFHVSLRLSLFCVLKGGPETNPTFIISERWDSNPHWWTEGRRQFSASSQSCLSHYSLNSIQHGRFHNQDFATSHHVSYRAPSDQRTYAVFRLFPNQHVFHWSLWRNLRNSDHLLSHHTERIVIVGHDGYAPPWSGSQNRWSTTDPVPEIGIIPAPQFGYLLCSLKINSNYPQNSWSYQPLKTVDFSRNSIIKGRRFSHATLMILHLVEPSLLSALSSRSGWLLVSMSSTVLSTCKGIFCYE